MTRLAIIFIATFCVGALIAVTIRTNRHHPYAMTEPMPPAAPSDQVQARPSSESVNTICSICGMQVNPALGTALYQGKRIGFGCKICPEQFAEDPEKYGPSALKNVVAD